MKTLNALLIATLTLVKGHAQVAAPAGMGDSEREIARYQASYRMAIDAFNAERDALVATLETNYAGALEKLQAERSKAGDLDGALAAKAERERILLRAQMKADDIKAMSAGQRRLRTVYETSLSKIEEDHLKRLGPASTKYIMDLETLEKQVTRSGDIEKALSVRKERDRFITEMGKMAKNTMGNTPTPAGVKPPTVSLPIGVKLADSMKIYSSGCNDCIITVNGKELMKVFREKPSMLAHRLREGDVIAVQVMTSRFDLNSFWLSCIASTGEFLFETNEQWTGYVPANENRWWVIKDPKEQKPVQFAPDKQEYVDRVKNSASQTPLYSGTQPIRSMVANGAGATWVYCVVTKADLVPKQGRTAETK